MVGNVHGCAVGVELAVDRCGVREQSKLRGCGCLDAGIVVHVGAGLLYEPIAYFEGLVGEVAGLPDGEAGWVAVPVVVGLGHVAHVMDLLAGVVEVDVFSVALEIVAAVLYAPEPVQLLTLLRALDHGGYLHVVLVEADSYIVTLSVTSVVSPRYVIVAPSGDLRQIKDLDNGTASLGVRCSRVNVGVGAMGDN